LALSNANREYSEVGLILVHYSPVVNNLLFQRHSWKICSDVGVYCLLFLK
jgi:hypothetical protein